MTKLKSMKSVGAAIIRDGECLAAQRGSEMSFSRKWEFPGGKIEPGETPQQALIREIREELEIEIEVGEYIGRGYGSGGQCDVTMDIYAAKQVGGQLELTEHAEHGWFAPDALDLLDWVEPASDVLLFVKSFLHRLPLQPRYAIVRYTCSPLQVAVRWMAMPTVIAMLSARYWYSLMSAELFWFKAFAPPSWSSCSR